MIENPKWRRIFVQVQNTETSLVSLVSFLLPSFLLPQMLLWRLLHFCSMNSQTFLSQALGSGIRLLVGHLHLGFWMFLQTKHTQNQSHQLSLHIISKFCLSINTNELFNPSDSTSSSKLPALRSFSYTHTTRSLQCWNASYLFLQLKPLSSHMKNAYTKYT